ncbi:MAG TPA: DUF2207 domain-containing protein [Mogibacterium sp.]|nr:DUF2207 domain-containing protein [Mogibacterium sp.]
MNSITTARKITRQMLAIFTCIFLIISYIFVMPSAVYSYDSYTTDNYDVEITVNEDNTFEFHEKIDINFLTARHGIYRYIPEKMCKIVDVKVPDYEKKVYRDSGNRVIKIGSPDRTVIGKNTYDIFYKMVVYDDKDTTEDILSLDVIPTGWENAIESATVRINLPKPAPLENIAIYSGYYGSRGNDNNVQIETSDDGKTILLNAEKLPYKNGITIYLELPEGYWVGETTPGKLMPWHILMFLIGPVIAFLLWLYHGRDDVMVKTLEFYPPEDMTPGEMGYFIDGVADRKDLISSIVYLADKGCLSIRQEGKRDFYLKKIKAPQDEPKYINTIFNGLFGKKNEVRIKDLGESFGKKYQTAETQLADMFTGKNSRYTNQSIAARAGAIIASTFPVLALGVWEMTSGIEFSLTGIGISALAILGSAVLFCISFDQIKGKKLLKGGLKLFFALLLMNIGLSGSLSTSETLDYVGYPKAQQIMAFVMIGTIVSIVFAVLALARTSKNTALMGRVLGFRDFIKTAELDKLNELVEEDPEYFYHILPYAYVFGLTNKWIKNFENIPINKPVWVESEYTIYDSYMMGRVLTDFSTNVSKNIVIPDSGDTFSGGGGGFSGGGGGFSGGGFGGGGGGAW